MKPNELARVVVDTTVQPKAVMFPTDAILTCLSAFHSRKARNIAPFIECGSSRRAEGFAE